MSSEKKVRLSKVISHAGYCSRNEAEILIKEGKVSLNERTTFDYVINKSQVGDIKVGGKYLKNIETKLWCFYKPRGYVCTNKEQANQKSFFRILPKKFPRVVSVGRLDILSEGLLLLTNSPKLSTFLERPENSIERIYHVKTSGKISKDSLSSLEEGITINGVRYKRVKVNILREKGYINFLKIKLVEGKNREIRKILNHFNLKVLILKRVKYGPFNIEKLEPGELFKIEDRILKKFLKKTNL